MLKHIADAETKFVVVNVNPDFCKVDGEVVAFDISRAVSEERASYAQDFFARGEKVLPVGSVVQGVEGNAGEGIFSGVAAEKGDNVTTTGSPVLFVNGRAVCRHDDEVEMNVKTGGGA